MKKLILITLLLFSNVAAAEVLPPTVWGDLTAIVKMGFFPGNGIDSSTRGLTIGMETRTCYKYPHCFNPYVVLIENDNGSNAGVGIDYRHKIMVRETEGFYVEFGPAIFQDPLNHPDANELNIHGGVGVDLYNFIISADVYVNQIEKVGLFSVGWHFK